VAPAKNERHYVHAAKYVTAFLAILGAFVSLVMTSISGAWQLFLGIGAGTGAVYLLRWYWWRINAWSEVSAMVAAGTMTALLRTVIHLQGSAATVFAKSILLTVAGTTVVWVVVTYLTTPEPDAKLLEFYRRVRPGGIGWKRVAALAPEIPASRDGWHNLMDWLLGCLMVYMMLFGIGKLLLGSPGLGMLFLAVAALAGSIIYWDFSRRGWETLSGKG
jgi:SSS family solute:Na+ symporter